MFLIQVYVEDSYSSFIQNLRGILRQLHPSWQSYSRRLIDGIFCEEHFLSFYYIMLQLEGVKRVRDILFDLQKVTN